MFDLPPSPPYELFTNVGVCAGAPAPVGIVGIGLSYRAAPWLVLRGAYEGGAGSAILAATPDSTDPVVPTGLTLNRLNVAALTPGPFYVGAGWTGSALTYQYANTPPGAATPQGAPVRVDLAQAPELILGARWPEAGVLGLQAEVRLALDGHHTAGLAAGARF